jgi:hypothetical protein
MDFPDSSFLFSGAKSRRECSHNLSAQFKLWLNLLFYPGSRPLRVATVKGPLPPPRSTAC